MPPLLASLIWYCEALGLGGTFEKSNLFPYPKEQVLVFLKIGFS
jgi:hypothetical protein